MCCTCCRIDNKIAMNLGNLQKFVTKVGSPEKAVVILCNHVSRVALSINQLPVI